MITILNGFWPTNPTLPSQERDRSQRLAIAEAHTADRRVEAASPIPRMLASFWRRSPETNRATA